MHDARRTAIHLIGGTEVCWLAAEPALNDMLADPITQLLMRRDGVQEAEIRRLAARLRLAEEGRRRHAETRLADNDAGEPAAV
ncbi:hypothetical protein [Ferrovibrio terrae]|uniref:hypothetical protein n=1 Tax=Ferrovibrio terrae TaxID=2594003 RepID=UPI00313800E1